MVLKATVIMPFAEFWKPFKWEKYPAIQLLHKHLKDIGVESSIIDLNEKFRKNIRSTIKDVHRSSGKLSDSLVSSIEKNPEKIFSDESIYAEVIRPFSYFSDPENYIINDIDDVEKKINSAEGKMLWRFTESVMTGKNMCADLFLITVPTHQHSVSASMLGKIIKKHYKKSHVSFGGPFITFVGKDAAMEFVRKGYCDTFVIGNGEPKITELVKMLGSNPKGEILGKDDMDVNLQINKYPINDGKPAKIILSIGCPWRKCAFCDFIPLNPSYSIKDLDVLLDEMGNLIENHGKNRFVLVAETLPPGYARKLSEAIIDKGWKIKWSPKFMRVERSFDKDMLMLMKKSGCDFGPSYIGIDVISEKGLKYANKGYSKDDIVAFLGEAEKAGITLGAVALIYDFPGTSIEDAIDGIRIMERYINTYDSINVNKFMLLKKSEMGRNPKRYGLEIVEDRKNVDKPLCRSFEFVDRNGLTDDEKKLISNKLAHIQMTLKACQHYENLEKKEYNDIKIYNPDRKTIRVRIPAHKEIIRKGSKDVYTHNADVLIDDTVLQSQYFLSKVNPGKWYSVEELSSLAGECSNARKFIQMQKTFRLVRELLAVGYFSDMIIEKQLKAPSKFNVVSISKKIFRNR